jgi:hypothetical protein
MVNAPMLRNNPINDGLAIVFRPRDDRVPIAASEPAAAR